MSLSQFPLHYQSATDLVEALKNGSLTSVELTHALLQRIREQNGPINAVVALNEEPALARAAEADAAAARGEFTGPLHGLPLTLKDTWEVAGLACTAGAPALKNHRPKHHANVQVIGAPGMDLTTIGFAQLLEDAGLAGFKSPQLKH